MATVKDKVNYVVHSTLLKQAIENGLKVTKVHRVLRFRQAAWMRPYIEMNNKVRASTNSQTKKDLCKLMNNAAFGKTMENVEKRRTIRLFGCWENQPTGKRGAVSFVSSGYLKRVTPFSKDFVAVELSQSIINLNKPVQLGFTVLELAKSKMYEFHYGFFKKVYPESKLCYTDTDSLIYYVQTEDLYADLNKYVHNPQRQVEKFDTSDYHTENPMNYKQMHKKELGAMKDENAGRIMTDFIGLRSKCYTYKVKEDTWRNKAKGIKKFIANALQPDEYTACLEDQDRKIYKDQYVFRSVLHNIFTENLHKVALNGADNKRFICNDGVSTLPWGHYKISEEEASRLTGQDIKILGNEF